MDNPEKLATLRTQYEDKQNKIITQYDHYNLCPNDIHVYAWSSCLSLSTSICGSRKAHLYCYLTVNPLFLHFTGV